MYTLNSADRLSLHVHYQTPIIVILMDKVIEIHTGNNLKLKLAFKAAQQDDDSKGSTL